MTRLRRDYIQRLELRRFSESTISSYVGVAAKPAQFHGCSPLNLTTRHLRDFLYDELKVKKLSAATSNQHIPGLSRRSRRRKKSKRPRRSNDRGTLASIRRLSYVQKRTPVHLWA